MNQRLQQFLGAENMSQSQFADIIDVARASVSHILAGRNKPSFEFIENMARHFPALNIEWLITGKGKMYKSAVPESVTNPVIEAGAAAPIGEEVDESQFGDDLFAAEFAGKPQPQTQSNKLDKPTQTLGNQKEITKIVVFYSDNTFQEFM